MKIYFLIFSIFYLGFQCYSQDIVAHRGASYDAPENTLASIKLGFEKLADAVEIDIRLTKDMKLILMHDHTVERTTGAKFEIEGTNYKELKKLDAGSWKSEQYRGEKVPLLKEILPHIPDGKKLIIELKGDESLVPPLEKVIKRKHLNKIVFISFNFNAIKEVKTIFPSVPSLWLLHNWESISVDQAIDLVEKHKIDGLNLHYGIIDKHVAEKVLNRNLKLYSYTINNPKEARRLRELGVEGITTDRPYYIKENL